jgi:hypothetical protein
MIVVLDRNNTYPLACFAVLKARTRKGHSVFVVPVFLRRFDGCTASDLPRSSYLPPLEQIQAAYLGVVLLTLIAYPFSRALRIRSLGGFVRFIHICGGAE